jgi:hypothetical protein
MNNPKYNNHQNALTKWMLAVAVLLSFVAYSAPVAQSAVKSQVHKTELVVNAASKPVKCVNFSSVSWRGHRANSISPFLGQSFVRLAALHSLQVNVWLKNHSTPCLRCVPVRLYSYIKTIPQSLGDTPAITLG